jgi:ABC-type sugar transport system permease subunit
MSAPLASSHDKEGRPAQAAPSWQRQRRLAAYLFIVPALLIVLAVSVYPLIYEIWLSFTDWYLLQNPTPVWHGLAGYQRLIADPVVRESLGRTAFWTIGTVALEYAVALPLALLLNRRSLVTGFLTGALLLPWVTPAIVVGYTWRWLLDSESGTVHAVLETVGLAGERSLLTEPNAVLPMLTAISAWKGIPFMAIALLAGMKGIPGELYEAAAIDGAGRVGQFRDITFPLLRPVSVITCLILGILAFYSFDLVWVITKGGPGDSSMLIGVYLFRLFFERLELSYAAVIGVAMLVLLVVFSGGYLRALGRTRT